MSTIARYLKKQNVTFFAMARINTRCPKKMFLREIGQVRIFHGYYEDEEDLTNFGFRKS